MREKEGFHWTQRGKKGKREDEEKDERRNCCFRLFCLLPLFLPSAMFTTGSKSCIISLSFLSYYVPLSVLLYLFLICVPPLNISSRFTILFASLHHSHCFCLHLSIFTTLCCFFHFSFHLCLSICFLLSTLSLTVSLSAHSLLPPSLLPSLSLRSDCCLIWLQPQIRPDPAALISPQLPCSSQIICSHSGTQKSAGTSVFHRNTFIHVLHTDAAAGGREHCVENTSVVLK